MPHKLLYDASRPVGAVAAAAPGSASLQHAANDRGTSESLAALGRQMHGELMQPGDPGYPAARRVFNRAVETRPAAIACCTGEDDIRACLAFARSSGMAFRVRGGGHNFAGYSVCDGLVIDVSLLNHITLDGEGALAVGGGCAQGVLGKRLEREGLHLPLGDWPDVGVGGFMQGGGYGITARSFGMNLDHVEAVRVMLADGHVVEADRHRNHDLWWAVRGGAAANFGVLTQIRYRTHRDVSINSTAMAWKLSNAAERAQAADVLALLQSDYARGGSANTNICVIACYGLDPDDSGMRGPWLVVSLDQVGSVHAMEKAAAPLRACPGWVEDFDYGALQRGSDIPAMRRQSRYIGVPVGTAGWRHMLDLLAHAPNRLTTMYLQVQGGAINATPRVDSAFVHRDAELLAYMDVFWHDHDEREAGLALQDRWTAVLEPFWNGRCYQNFADPALQDYRGAYWGDAFPALLAVKRKYDPTDLFRSPQMIAAPHGEAVAHPEWPPLVVHALAQAVDR
jgi:FAD/FMN-containing dehydrogenase